MWSYPSVSHQTSLDRHGNCPLLTLIEKTQKAQISSTWTTSPGLWRNNCSCFLLDPKCCFLQSSILLSWSSNDLGDSGGNKTIDDYRKWGRVGTTFHLGERIEEQSPLALDISEKMNFLLMFHSETGADLLEPPSFLFPWQVQVVRFAHKRCRFVPCHRLQQACSCPENGILLADKLRESP